MSITTIVFFGLLAFFTWRGYQKGFISSITRILGWIVAYPAAIIFTKPVAGLLMQHTALDGLIVYFIAGTGIFLLVSLLVSLLLSGIARLIPESDAINVGSKIGGAGVGVLMGALVGLLAVYILGLIFTPKTPILPDQHSSGGGDYLSAVDSTAQVNSQTATNVPRIQDLAQHNDSFIEASAKKLIGSAAATAVDLALHDQTATQITKAFVQDPQSMLSHVQQVANNGQMKNLIADEKIQSILTTGDTHALMRDPAFKEMMNNPSVQALLSQSDVTSDEGSQVAAEKMVTAWRRAQTIKHDPRVIAIINDPEFQQQLNSTNKLPLLANPKLNQLAAIIFDNNTPAANGMGNYEVQDANENNPLTPRVEEEKKPATTIYRWTDDKGQVHYSDKPK
ncbi:CvpA family protein [Cellvibrio sp. UBA7661]|uniref:CvpA family protein n=1 Tax=Cellvibrio sp. UBA7661 TaxID=1946311 RepID=UPI002F352EEB